MQKIIPRKRTFLAAALVATAACLSPTITVAQSSAVFDGSKARVNLSNKLTMLTQTIASASCRIEAGFGTAAALRDLKLAYSDFNTILNGLENSSTALGIPSAEKHSVVKKSISKVREVWMPIDSAALTLLETGSGGSSAANVIADYNIALLEATNILASDISGKYSNPHELTQSDAMALHISGRQRMLGHQMAKEVCGIATGVTTLGTASKLGQTLNMYQVSLNALREGMVEAGVNPPPNDAIRGELDAVYATWQQSVPALSAISSGTSPSPDNVETIAALSSNLMTAMSNIVTLYMLATPGQEDVYRVPLQAYAENELSKWLQNPGLIDAVRAQNDRHRALSQAQIDQLDLDWRAQRKAKGGPLISSLLGHPSSEWLRGKQAETANFVTEVFAMDNRGLNVAQSVETSDYWQGDESKWQKTIGNGSGDIHISEVEFDESTGSYQSQVSMPIVDPANGQMIGAITFGINVQSLL